MASSVLELTTELAPAKKVRIDEEDYQLLNFDHLTPEDEASVTATFARFQKVFGRLMEAKNDALAETEATKLRRYREKLIEQMTDIPVELIRKLGAAKQGQLLSAIEDEINAAAGEEEDDGDGGDGEE